MTKCITNLYIARALCHGVIHPDDVLSQVAEHIFFLWRCC